MNTVSRLGLTRSAMWACGATVVWALGVGIAAIGVGTADRSLALVGFGLNSLVDGSASAVLVWRFSLEGRSADRANRVEHVALRLVGAALLSAATYVAVQAVRDLTTPSGPTPTTLAILLAGVSVLVLPLLAFIKLRLARKLGSTALRGDGVLSAAGASLASAALLGLVLSNAFGWWWADSIAALIIGTVLAREGWRALRAWN